MNPQMNRYQNPFSGQINVPVIPGKMVMNENAITPQDIPMDGNVSLFPQADWKCVWANRMADKDEIIAQLRTQLNQCTLAASQQAQNQYLISQLRPSANPAYIVDNPFRSTGNLPCQQPTCCNG